MCRRIDRTRAETHGAGRRRAARKAFRRSRVRAGAELRAARRARVCVHAIARCAARDTRIPTACRLQEGSTSQEGRHSSAAAYRITSVVGVAKCYRGLGAAHVLMALLLGSHFASGLVWQVNVIVFFALKS